MNGTRKEPEERVTPQFSEMLMWGQPPSPALSEAEGAVQSGETRRLRRQTETLPRSVIAVRNSFLLAFRCPLVSRVRARKPRRRLTRCGRSARWRRRAGCPRYQLSAQIGRAHV